MRLHMSVKEIANLINHLPAKNLEQVINWMDDTRNFIKSFNMKESNETGMDYYIEDNYFTSSNNNYNNIVSAKYANKEYLITESSLNDLLKHTTYMGKKPEPEEWAIFTSYRYTSRYSGEKVSKSSNEEKLNQLKLRVKNKGYSFINTFGGWIECEDPSVSEIEKCPLNKRISVTEKSIFVIGINYRETFKLMSQLYRDVDYNNDKTKKEIGRFGQDGFIHANKEHKYNAYLYTIERGINNNIIAKKDRLFAKLHILNGEWELQNYNSPKRIKNLKKVTNTLGNETYTDKEGKKQMYYYTAIKNKFFTLEHFDFDHLEKRTKGLVETSYAHSTQLDNLTNFLCKEIESLTTKEINELISLIK